nr:glycoside hydrolase family 15 protein [Desulfitobacterium hafniense]
MEIQKHWDYQKQLILPTLDKQNDPGCKAKTSNLDIAVVLGALHGCAGDGFFCSRADAILMSAEKLKQSFEVLYPINSVKKDFFGEPVGTAIGRYPEDCYHGQTASTQAGGWFLANNAFAEMYYNVARAWRKSNVIRVTPFKAVWIKSLIKDPNFKLHSGETVFSQDPRFSLIVQAVREAGDEEIRRTRLHMDQNGSMSEQFNRNTGFMMSARDLTWNYASFLTAYWAR